MKNRSVWSLAQYLLRIIFHLSRSVNMLLYSTRPLYLWSTISNHPNIVFPYMFMIYCLSFLTFHHIFNLIWFWILYSYSEFDNDCNMWMLCKEWEHTITHVTYFRIIWYYLTLAQIFFVHLLYIWPRYTVRNNPSYLYKKIKTFMSKVHKHIFINELWLVIYPVYFWQKIVIKANRLLKYLATCVDLVYIA